MDFRLTLALLPEEMRDTEHRPSIGSGLKPDELPAVLTGVAGEARVELGSVGKGAAGGFDLVLHIAEETLTDGAATFAWGGTLWAVVRRIRRPARPPPLCPRSNDSLSPGRRFWEPVIHESSIEIEPGVYEVRGGGWSA
jgi:hypothetical protein